MPTPQAETDYYVLLGVDPGADAGTIRKAIVGEQRRCGARQNAPDLATRQDAERHAQLLTGVRDVLLNPGQRALYDIQRVEELPDRPPPPAANRPIVSRRMSRTVGGDWSRRVAGIGVAATLLVFLASRATSGTVPVSAAASPAAARPHVALSQLPVPAMPEASTRAASQPAAAVAVRTRAVVADTPPPVPTRVAAVAPRGLPDEVPVTLSGTPLLTSIVPPPGQPFSLAGGRYNIAWSVAGRQPCDFVITIADPITPALIRTTLSNHVLNRSDGQPAQGETSVALNSGRYRLEAYSDACAWSLTLRAS